MSVRITWKASFVLAFLLWGVAVASQVHHKELAEVLTPERPVVWARVVRSEVEIQPNVLLVRVEVDEVEPVYLQPPQSRVWVHSFSTVLNRKSADGREVRVSPIREGSGMEQNLEVGERYLFILGAGGAMIRPKPRLDLYAFEGAGVIIPWLSGVMISNQCGGHCCLHPEVEGVFVPLQSGYESPGRVFSLGDRLDPLFFGPGSKYNGTGAARGPDSGLDLEDADFIDSVLDELRYRYIRVDRNRLKESVEAWIWVMLTPDSDPALLCGFGPYPRPGILTWANCD